MPQPPDPEQPSGALTLRTLTMPRDVNNNGDIFGGWVLQPDGYGGGDCGLGARAWPGGDGGD